MSTRSGIRAPSKRSVDSNDRNGGESMSRSSSVSTLASTTDIKAACQFVVGDKAFVNGTKPGTIQYLGETQFAPGIWAGVKLDEFEGKNDGSVNGVKYFECAPNQGIFIRPHRLTKEPGAPPVIGDSPNQSLPPRSPLDGRTTPSRLHQAPSRPTIKLRVGDRVLVNSASGIKYGILRYIGTTEFAAGEWAGIQLDDPVGKNDGSVADKRYFECAMHHGLFAPAHKVLKATGTPRSTSHPNCLQSRSYSRESLDSNASSVASRGSRVKLGITSLHKTQRSQKSPSSALSPTQNALQEALKEKEEHLDQLFKEREQQRQEISVLTLQLVEEKQKLTKSQEEQSGYVERTESKIQQLQNLWEKAELEGKNASAKLLEEKRKMEDMQFQFDEEKSELEVQMQQEHEKVVQLENLMKGEKQNAEILEKLKELESALVEKDSLLKKTSIEVQALEASLKGKDSDIAQLTSSLEVVTKSTESLKNEAEEKADLKSKMASLEKDKEQLTLKNYEIVRKLADLENTMQQSDGQMKKNDSEFQALRNLLGEKESEIMRLNSLLDSAKINDQDLKSELEKMNTLKLEISKLIKDKEADRNEYSSKIQHWEELVSKKEEQICALKSEKFNLEKDVDENTKKISTLNSLLEKEKSDKMQTTQMSEELKEKTLKESEKLSELTTNLNSLKTELGTKENKIKEHESRITTLNQMVDEKSAKVTNLEQQLLEAQQKYSGEVIMNKTQHQNLLEKISILESECSKHETVLAEKALQNEEKIRALLLQVKSQEDLKRNMETEIQDLSNEVNAKGDAITSLTNQLKQALDEVSLLTTNKSEMTVLLQNKINDMKKEAERHQSEFDAAMKRACAEKESLSKLLEEQEKFSMQNANLEATLRDTIRQKETQLTQLTAELENTEARINDFTSRMNLLQGQLTTTESEKETLIKEKEEMSLNISDLKMQATKYAQLLRDQSSESSLHQNQVEELQEKLKEKEDQITDLASLIEESQKKLEQLKSENNKNVTLMESQMDIFKAEQEKHLLEKEKVLQAEIVKLESQINEKATVEKTQQAKILEMTNTIGEKENNIHDLKQTMKDKEKKMGDLIEKDTKQISEQETALKSLQTQCGQLQKEKDEIAQREKAAIEAQQALEKAKDNLIQEKMEQVALVKVKDTKLQLLQMEVEKMQKEFNQHRQELQGKLSISQMELEAMKEFKAELNLQQGIVEELQNKLINSDNEQKKLLAEMNSLSEVKEQKEKMEKQITQMNTDLLTMQERSTAVKKENEKLQTDTMMFHSKLKEKDAEIEVLKLRLEFYPSSKQQKIESDEILARFKSMEDEKAALLAEISKLKSSLFIKDESGDASKTDGSYEEEEKEALRSQINFLNSIIVDMQREKEELKLKQEHLDDEALTMDINFNGVKKIPPRLFCDICDMFDLHDTEDCPTQASCLEEVPHSRHHGKRNEERPYCNNCEIFGHWTLDCNDTETF